MGDKGEEVEIDGEEVESDDYPFEGSDDEFSSGFRHMTRPEFYNYVKQVDQSDGFEVDGIPNVREFHQIKPVRDHEIEECILYAKLAIDMFNNSVHKMEEGELEFDQLLRATKQLLFGLMYYLTFTAKKKNLDMGVEICTYQAMVLWGRKPDVEVLSFRRKPSGSEKDWFWADHDE